MGHLFYFLEFVYPEVAAIRGWKWKQVCASFVISSFRTCRFAQLVSLVVRTAVSCRNYRPGPVDDAVQQ